MPSEFFALSDSQLELQKCGASHRARCTQNFKRHVWNSSSSQETSFATLLNVKAICEEPVSRCPPLRRQRCPRDTTWRSAQKSPQGCLPLNQLNRSGQPREDNPRQPARRRSVSLNKELRLPVGRASALGHWWALVCVGVWEWTNAATVLCHSQED
ncbi:hypothetical protein CEXT_6801 [Caerostris extrusa]|uniref:Uncharacterized protein n=1 Tax=Caerostris extrusa TaxID=172846 RepID=A0AAV4XKV2_CAEEX|nr:hypothetical protein CEXT_6801 [Caerostris extrusa]